MRHTIITAGRQRTATTPSPTHAPKRRPVTAFTLLELLIVIGILAVLATIAVLVINPAEYTRKSRDAKRIADLTQINKALQLAEVEKSASAFGATSTVYVSLPDTSAACASYALPALPVGYAYHCSDQNSYRKTDGTGWVPVDFTSLFTGSPLASLPIDPSNTNGGGLYYTYIPGGSWELTAVVESADYKARYSQSLVTIGTSIATLTPAGVVGRVTAPGGMAYTDSAGESLAYRKPITITNGATSTLSNQWMAISLDTQQLITGGKMRADGGDLRMLDSDGSTVLPFKMDASTVNTTATKVFVDLDTLPAGTKTVYAAYGNSGLVKSAVTSQGDGSVTIASGTKNMNTDIIATGRTCADAPSYAMTANVSAGATSLTVATTTLSGCVAAGDEVLIANLQGASGNYASVGAYETRYVASVAGAAMTLTSGLVNGYDGTTQKIVVQRVPQYQDVTISSGASLSANAWDGTKGGVLFFRALGTVNNAGTVTMTGKAYRGNGTQTGGEGLYGANSATAGGGGGGGYRTIGNAGCNGYSGGGGGGGAGYGAAGSAGANYGSFGGGGGGGATYGSQELAKIFLGAGGGGGGYGACGGPGGTGGIGGGVIGIFAKTITNTGAISANGAIGNGGQGGGGGGSAGGSVLLSATDVSAGASLVTAAGSAGATNGGWDATSISGNGGAGAIGRIAIYYGNSNSGTTNPVSFARQMGTAVGAEQAP